MLFFARTWNVKIKNNGPSCINYETFTPGMQPIAITKLLLIVLFPVWIGKTGLL